MGDTDESTRMNWRVRIFITAICMVAVMFLYPASVQAGNVLHTRAVPAGQVVDNDVFLTGEKPVLNGTVNGDVFIIGSNVTITGEVNGSIIVVAKTIALPGKVNGNLYAAALELTQQPDSLIGRNLYALVLSLITEPGSAIGRDLKTVTMSANFQGQTERDTTAIIGPWELFKILQDFFNQYIKGSFPAPAPTPSQPTSMDGNLALVSFSTSHPRRASVQAEQPAQYSVQVEWLLAALESMVSFLVVGLLALWLFPSLFQGWVEKVQREPLAAAGYGAIVLINGHLLPVLVLSLLIGLLLGLIYLSLSSLAWIFFWAGLGFLMTTFTLFLVATTFLSKAIVAYLVGAAILSRIASRSLRYRILPLLLGLLLYVPLDSIPYVGFFIGLVATLLGLGSIWLSRRQALQPEKAVVETASA